MDKRLFLMPKPKDGPALSYFQDASYVRFRVWLGYGRELVFDGLLFW